jgi:hypothetical protein
VVALASVVQLVVLSGCKQKVVTKKPEVSVVGKNNNKVPTCCTRSIPSRFGIPKIPLKVALKSNYPRKIKNKAGG